MTSVLRVPVDRIPRLLLIEPEPIWSPGPVGTYFGELVRGWPRDRFLQVSTVGDGKLSLVDVDGTQAGSHALTEVVERVGRFAADVVVYRPDGTCRGLQHVADLAGTSTPLVLAILDLWPDRLRVSDPSAAHYLGAALDEQLQTSAARFAVTEPMAEYLSELTGVQFEVIPNLIDLERWKPLPRTARPVKTFDMSGRVAGDKVGTTAMLIATVFAARRRRLSRLRVRLSHRSDETTYLRSLRQLRNVSASRYDQSRDRYRARLNAADVAVIAFSFSDVSSRYLKYSFANRITEALALGKPVLAVGPATLLSMQFLRESGAAVTVTTPDTAAISKAVTSLSTNSKLRAELSRNARIAAAQFDAKPIRERFRDLVSAASLVSPPARPSPSSQVHHSRSVSADHSEPVELLHSPSRTDLDRIVALHGAHGGETCIIVGNGPSLRGLDLDRLQAFPSFGSNGIFLAFERTTWRPTYYCSVDSRFLPDRVGDIATMLEKSPSTTGFFPTVLELHDGSEETIPLPHRIRSLSNSISFRMLRYDAAAGSGANVSLRLDRGLVSPKTVTVALMQLAAHMGFSRMILVGCDTSYSVPTHTISEGPKVDGSKHQRMLLTSKYDDDPNHFDPTYFGAQRAWHYPNVEAMVEHYRHVSDVFGAYGIEVINSTSGGNLEVFPRLDLGVALGSSAN